MELSREVRGMNVRYSFSVGIEGTLDEVEVVVDFGVRGADEPSIWISGPECLRHRWGDNSACIWVPGDILERRWVLSDGFEKLLSLIRIHVFCEESCRQGEKWPKAESAGAHPRKRECSTCHGEGK